MTVRIALCDDEAAELDKMEKLLGVYEQGHPGMDFLIQRFECTELFLGMIGTKKFVPDVVFMDIFLPGEDGESSALGMEAAKKLRDLGNRAKLYFLTTSREYALEAFDVEAAGYLVKPVPEDKLFSVLDRFLEDAEQTQKQYILLKKEGTFVKILLSDVIYCEAQGKYQCIYLADGTKVVQNMTMAKLYDMCSVCREFVKMGVSYIINLEHIDSLSAQEIRMDNGKAVYPPRGTYRSLRERYFDYYCRTE